MHACRYVEQSAGRIFRALFEIALRRGWADLAKKALLWSKVVEKRFWSVQTPLRHFKEIPEVLVVDLFCILLIEPQDILRKIEKKDIRFEQYYDYKPHEIGELLRAPKLGSKITGLGDRTGNLSHGKSGLYHRRVQASIYTSTSINSPSWT